MVYCHRRFCRALKFVARQCVKINILAFVKMVNGNNSANLQFFLWLPVWRPRKDAMLDLWGWWRVKYWV